MPHQFRKAVRGGKPLLCGISGPTGSGKTYSALRLAVGLAGSDGGIYMIDTENGRGRFYADEFDYLYTELEPPFSPERYTAAIQDAIDDGARVVIVDSDSHCWEGIGGCREEADQIAHDMAARWKKSPDTYSFQSWSKPKQALSKKINHLVRADCHIILCWRAKEKRSMAKDDKGKTEIINLGWQPISDYETPYECAFLAMLDPEKPGTPHFTHKALSHQFKDIFSEGAQVNEEMGKKLAAWCEAQSPQAPEAEALSEDEIQAMYKEACAATEEGTDRLREFWQGLDPKWQHALDKYRVTLKEAAAEYDKIKVQGETEEEEIA